MSERLMTYGDLVDVLARRCKRSRTAVEDALADPFHGDANILQEAATMVWVFEQYKIGGDAPATKH